MNIPFSGEDGGVGIEKGRLGTLQYIQYKHRKRLYWGLNEQPLAWGA
jgi:hypothetical protein